MKHSKENLKLREANPYIYKWWSLHRCQLQSKWYKSSTKFIKAILRKIGSRPSSKHALRRVSRHGKFKVSNLCWARKCYASSKLKARYPYIFGFWNGAKSRCTNENVPAYPRYGGRGISMYPIWLHSFDKCVHWILANLGDRPSAKHSVDRIDNDGNYEPGNIRWADKRTQSNNQSRTTIKLTYRGMCMSVPDWAEHTGISASTLYKRFYDGLPMSTVMRA